MKLLQSKYQLNEFLASANAGLGRSMQWQSWRSNENKLYLFNGLSNLHIFSAVLMPFFMGWGGLSIAQTLLLQSWFTFCAFALEIPTGVIADVFSRKLSLILGALIAIIGFLWYPVYPNFWFFMFGEFLLALGLALRSGAGEALLCDSIPKASYSRALPRFGSFGMLGIVIGPLIGAVLVNFFEPRWIFLLQAIPSVLALLLALTLSESSKSQQLAKSSADVLESNSLENAEFAEKASKSIAESTRVWDTFLSGWQFFKSHQYLKLLALDMAVVAGVAKMMIWLYQVRLAGLVSLEWFGWIISSAVLLELVAMNLYNYVANRWQNRRAVIFISGVLPAIGFLLAGLSQNICFILLGIYLAISVGMSRKPFFSVIYNENISSARRATILSTIAMSSQLFLAVLHPIIGKLADWSVSGSFIVLGIGLFIFSVWSSWRLRFFEI